MHRGPGARARAGGVGGDQPVLDLQRYQEALAAFDEALTMRPEYSEARAGREEALRALGREAEGTPQS